MTQTGSTLLTIVAWTSLAVAFGCAAVIAVDAIRHSQPMKVMNVVWPVTALYFGPLALWMYWRRERAVPENEAAEQPRWWTISKSTSHCGAGCTLGDIVGEWLVYLTGWSVALFAAEDANTLTAMIIADFALAWTFGIIFQYFSIVPMHDDIGRARGLWLAVRADTLSIVSFQVGLFGFMALYHLVIYDPPLSVASPGYWLMMQIGMILGFFTSWPVNALLVRAGWKEEM
jgi:hypothetical protein